MRRLGWGTWVNGIYVKVGMGYLGKDNICEGWDGVFG